MPRLIDLTGNRFGKLTVIRRDGYRGKTRPLATWIVKCDCGVVKSVIGCNLRSGKTQSCGTCAGVERRRLLSRPEFHCWQAMIQRCENPNCHAYGSYGGRGISICPRWRESFDAFVEDVGRRPSKRHSLDRIDNDGNYEPGNVRWATMREQSRNRRTCNYLTVAGETMSIVEWSEVSGVKERTIGERLRRGWDDHRAVFESV